VLIGTLGNVLGPFIGIAVIVFGTYLSHSLTVVGDNIVQVSSLHRW
jgi:hypothetical protein